jgi:hypothetical protein
MGKMVPSTNQSDVCFVRDAAHKAEDQEEQPAPFSSFFAGSSATGSKSTIPSEESLCTSARISSTIAATAGATSEENTFEGDW